MSFGKVGFGSLVMEIVSSVFGFQLPQDGFGSEPVLPKWLVDLVKSDQLLNERMWSIWSNS